MDRPPRKSTDSLFAGGMAGDILYQGLMVAAITLLSYAIGYSMETGYFGIPSGTSPKGMTMAFLTMNMCEIFHSFNMRSQRHSIFSMKKQNRILWAAMAGALIMATLVTCVPQIAVLFGFTTVSIRDYGIALGLSILVIPIVEIVKAVQRAVQRQSTPA